GRGGGALSRRVRRWLLSSCVGCPCLCGTGLDRFDLEHVLAQVLAELLRRTRREQAQGLLGVEAVFLHDSAEQFPARHPLTCSQPGRRREVAVDPGCERFKRDVSGAGVHTESVPWDLRTALVPPARYRYRW